MSVGELACRHPAKALLLTAALMLAAVTWTVWSMFGDSLRQELRANTESAHSAFTRVFVNDHWDALRPLLDLEGRQADAAGNPNLRAIDGRVRGFARGTDLIGVRIFNARGVILYSSDLAEVGRSKAADPGFLTAARGRVASALVHRDTFNAFDGPLRDRSLVESYVPVRGVAGVEAVVEMYTDRTDSVLGLELVKSGLLRWLIPVLGLGFAVVLLSSTWINRALQQREALARADAQESQLMSQAASHEAEARQEVLQTMLAQLDAPMQRLRAHSLPDAAAGDLASLQRQATRLALWNRLQDGRTSVAPCPARLSDCLQGALQAVADEVARRGVQLVVHLDEALGGRTLGHGAALQEMLTLMMEGAVEVSGSGPLQVKVQTAPAGISVDLITSAGTTLNPPRAQELLAMAEALAGPLGGRLDAKFTPGRGGWIQVLLPGHGVDAPARPGA